MYLKKIWKFIKTLNCKYIARYLERNEISYIIILFQVVLIKGLSSPLLEIDFPVFGCSVTKINFKYLPQNNNTLLIKNDTK